MFYLLFVTVQLNIHVVPGHCDVNYQKGNHTMITTVTEASTPNVNLILTSWY